jgi:hypothetical protein
MGKQGYGEEGLLPGSEKAPDKLPATVKNGKKGLFSFAEAPPTRWAVVRDTLVARYPASRP